MHKGTNVNNLQISISCNFNEKTKTLKAIDD